MLAVILELVKARLGRSDTALDGYLAARIEAVIAELNRNGIHIRECADDEMLVCDLVAWDYSNRDKNADMPMWLKTKRRERFLAEGHDDT